MPLNRLHTVLPTRTHTFSEGCVVSGEEPAEGVEDRRVCVLTLHQVSVKVVVMDTDLVHQRHRLQNQGQSVRIELLILEELLGE